MNLDLAKRRLREKGRELLIDTKRLAGEARASGADEVRDSTDAATASEGASESLHEEALASQTLSQVRDALQRVEDGTYGKCTICGRPIEPARLEAIPWAAYCLEDQEKQDKAARVEQGGSTL